MTAPIVNCPDEVGVCQLSTLSILLQNPLSLVRKFFAYDKNYLLEEAQLLVQDKLLDALVEKVKDHYFALHNPLGLDDKLSVDIDRYRIKNRMPLNDFYQNLAGIYRYKFGQNQLEFLWDGCDHIEKYKNDWAAFFEESTDRFCKNPLFIQAVLDLTVFLPENRNASLSENRMNHFMLQHFDVRIHKQRGIVKMNVA